MVTRIRKFSILQTGKVLFVFYGFFSIVLCPFFLIMLIAKPGEAFRMLAFLIAYPVLGFIGGIIGAAIYNLTSRFSGGFELTMEITQEQDIQS
jgi:ABC-type transport system involved in cytochrome c biogenesis permease component